MYLSNQLPNLSSSTFLKFIILTWLGFVISGLVYFQAEQSKPFDSDKVLLQDGWFLSFKNQPGLNTQTHQASLILVLEQSCGCTKQAKSHITALKRVAEEKGFNIIQHPCSAKLKHVIPATPAAIIMDKHGEFVYAGPLSEGLACSQGSGFVETAINNLVAGFNSGLLVADTKGCYCINIV
ncbi:DUF6436 domain-containing protein [Pseudoalteromonas sp. H71]|uniref:DUF6436 domain-containing protein n=1 Tax=Pseudoalteromonas sp. H71 TaxID=1348395 RepID=UPI0009EBEEE8|nr:DUF6436 domain-containing protein [Pseudoalteromonas sp. H71]